MMTITDMLMDRAFYRGDCKRAQAHLAGGRGKDDRIGVCGDGFRRDFCGELQDQHAGVCGGRGNCAVDELFLLRADRASPSDAAQIFCTTCGRK